MRIPLSKPNPAKLSESAAELRSIEQRGIYSNFGPVNTAFERNITQQLFGSIGECITVCNATIGLMLAIRETIESRPKSRRRYALMPSFTFAAAAQAALWNRLTPLFCDIDPVTWAADPKSERELLARFGDQIAVVVPYATFGYNIDLDWYEAIQQQYGIPVVVDAAASLGTIARDGHNFGTGFSSAIVYSMHVTKSFSTAEGGLIYSNNADLIGRLHSMSNFGFSQPRNAELMGLNGKLSEVSALLASLCLENFDAVTTRRAGLVSLYRRSLPELTFQPETPYRQAHQFTAALLPAKLADYRAEIQQEMVQRGVGSATYFSPHVAEQTYFSSCSRLSRLPVTQDVASRVLTLPLFDTMTESEVKEVVAVLKAAMQSVSRKHHTLPRAPFVPANAASSGSANL